MSTHLRCQVCGRLVTPKKDGTSRTHRRYRNRPSQCPGSGHRVARWKVHQRLRHHAGSTWTVIESGGNGGDYVLRCEFVPGHIIERKPGSTMTVHAEYMHRHGWTEAAR